MAGFVRRTLGPRSRIVPTRREDRRGGTWREIHTPRKYYKRPAYLLDIDDPTYAALRREHGMRGAYFLLPDAARPTEPAHMVFYRDGERGAYRVTLNRQTALARQGLETVGAPVIERVVWSPQLDRYTYAEIEGPAERTALLRVYADTVAQLKHSMENRRPRSRSDAGDEILKRWVDDHAKRSPEWFIRQRELI